MKLRLIGSIISLFLCSYNLFAQHGDPTLRRMGYLDSNNIGISVYNDGQISGFNTGVDIRGEWPRGSDEFYIGDMTPMIGVEFIDTRGETLHSVIISRGPRNNQSNEKHPVYGYFWGFNPLPGFLNPNTPSFARSNDSSSWPTTWADHPEYGSNVWNGFLGPNQFIPGLETYFQMDDYWDDEFNSYFLPDTTDSTKKGYGISVAVRYFQLAHPLFNDVLIKMYDITNTGTYNYEKVVFGTITGSMLGGDGDLNDDIAFIDRQSNFIYAWDNDGVGNQGQKVGVIGEAFIQTPDNDSIGSFSHFSITASPPMNDDELLWSRLKPGRIDSIIPSPQDGDHIYGTNYFSLASGETKRVVSLLAMGYTKDEIGQKVLAARALWNSKFNMDSVLHSAAFTNLNNHRELSGTEIIEWSSTRTGGTVDLWYSPDYGEHWALVEKLISNTGSYQLATENLQDSPFGLLKIFIKDEQGSVYALALSHDVSVNNASDGIPFIKILDQGFTKDDTVRTNTQDIQILSADVEEDSLTMEILYSIDGGNVFSLADSLMILSDTIPQTVSINITTLPNSHRMIFKILVSDGNSSAQVVTDRFVKMTNRDTVGGIRRKIISGFAQIPWRVTIVDSSRLTGHDYYLTFEDKDSTTGAYKKYLTVFDSTAGYNVLSQQAIIPNVESPVFDGLSFYNEDILTTKNENFSRWNDSSSSKLTYTFNPFYWSGSGTGLKYNCFRMPNDYAVIFYSDVVDTSLADTLYPNTPSNRISAKPISYRIKNLTTGEFVKTVFFKTGTVTTAFNIYFKEDIQGTLKRTWRVNIFDDTANAPMPASDTLYLYTVKGISMFDTLRVFDVTTAVGDYPELPLAYKLEQNYPNPFNPLTIISYQLKVKSDVSLKVYDILGREVATLVDEVQQAGVKSVEWNATNFSSGIYFYRLQAENFVETRKLVLVR